MRREGAEGPRSFGIARSSRCRRSELLGAFADIHWPSLRSFHARKLAGSAARRARTLASSGGRASRRHAGSSARSFSRLLRCWRVTSRPRRSVVVTTRLESTRRLRFRPMATPLPWLFWPTRPSRSSTPLTVRRPTATRRSPGAPSARVRSARTASEGVRAKRRSPAPAFRRMRERPESAAGPFPLAARALRTVRAYFSRSHRCPATRCAPRWVASRSIAPIPEREGSGVPRRGSGHEFLAELARA